jgi:hypothetical protein
VHELLFAMVIAVDKLIADLLYMIKSRDLGRQEVVNQNVFSVGDSGCEVTFF